MLVSCCSVCPSLAPLCRAAAVAGGEPIKKDVAHLAGERAGVAVGARPVPGVDPVHHAEKAEDGDADLRVVRVTATAVRRARFYAPAALPVRHQPNADAVILTLDGGDLGAGGAPQHVVLVRENAHRFRIGQEVFQMVVNEDADALLGIAHAREPLPQRVNHRAEGVLLDQVKQLLFRLEVVIKTGQRHARGARKVAHAGAFVSFFAENLGRMAQDLRHAAVEAGIAVGRSARRRSWGRQQGHEEQFERSFESSQYRNVRPSGQVVPVRPGVVGLRVWTSRPPGPKLSASPGSLYNSKHRKRTPGGPFACRSSPRPGRARPSPICSSSYSSFHSSRCPFQPNRLPARRRRSPHPPPRRRRRLRPRSCPMYGPPARSRRTPGSMPSIRTWSSCAPPAACCTSPLTPTTRTAACSRWPRAAWAPA